MTTGQPTRPLRSDAAENLRRILAAARVVISTDGVEAPMELIAERAEVGVGTLYRRFPNKDALIDALVDSILEDLLAAADTALHATDGSGLEQFLHALGRAYLAHHGCIQQLMGRVVPGERQAELRARIDRLFDLARHQGQLARHTTRGDVQALIWAMRGVVESTAAVAPRAWERHLDLHLAGLRVQPPPTRRASLSRPQLDAIAATPPFPAHPGRPALPPLPTTRP